MIAMIRSAIAAQYGASLSMLRGCIEHADSVTWLDAVGMFPYWHVAYDTLYYTDLYLSANEPSFSPQPFHREGDNFLGPQPWAPDIRVIADQPYIKDTLLTYLDTSRIKAKRTIDSETEATLVGPSGFSWLELTRLELHLYNIRHLQHHTGQLGAVLRRQAGEAVNWISSELL